jgi:type IV pilus assembly protein PilM
VRSILKSVSEGLSLEIQKTLDYFRAADDAEAIQRVYVCGGASRTQGLSEYLGQELGLAVEQLDPFKAVRVTRNTFPIDETLSSRADFAIAVGLAMRTG